MNDSEKKDPKLIIDEDWKSQVEAEKETLRKQAESGQSSAGADADASATGSTETSPKSGGSEPGAEQQMPPASFSFLVSTLATQALAAMGQIPDPQTGQATVERGVEKHFIDTLEILEEKTKGNLAAEETTMLSNVLHELRMLFVSTR